MKALLFTLLFAAAHAQSEVLPESAAMDAIHSSAAVTAAEEIQPTAAAPVELKWSELEVRRRVDIPFPSREFHQLSLSQITCEVWFTNDVRGRPYDVKVSDCHERFHADIEKTAKRWRFKPVERDGERVETTAVLRVHFQRR